MGASTDDVHSDSKMFQLDDEIVQLEPVLPIEHGELATVELVEPVESVEPAEPLEHVEPPAEPAQSL